MKRIARVTICGLMAAWLGADPALAQPRAGGVLRVALRAEVSTFDPHKGASGTDHMYLYPVFDTLVRFDDKPSPPGSPSPGDARSEDAHPAPQEERQVP
jgi:peptide/nickel transport system permease protein/peptide/nickel transport system substrate-binding protein